MIDLKLCYLDSVGFFILPSLLQLASADKVFLLDCFSPVYCYHRQVPSVD
jgi:hypothetical protein